MSPRYPSPCHPSCHPSCQPIGRALPTPSPRPCKRVATRRRSTYRAPQRGAPRGTGVHAHHEVRAVPSPSGSSPCGCRSLYPLPLYGRPGARADGPPLGVSCSRSVFWKSPRISLGGCTRGRGVVGVVVVTCRDRRSLPRPSPSNPRHDRVPCQHTYRREIARLFTLWLAN
jgi:hypothetical protein